MATTSQQKANGATRNTTESENRNSASSNSTSGQVSNSAIVGQANSGLASQQATTKADQTDAIQLATKPITLLYGGTKYQLSVPAADSGGKKTHVSAVVVPGGIVWATPAGYPSVSAQPIPTATIWFTPGRPLAGTKSLWKGAKRLYTFDTGDAKTPLLVGATGGYVLVQRSMKRGQTTMDALKFSRTKVSTANSIKQIAAFPEKDLHGYGRGVFAWKHDNTYVHVVKLESGAKQTVKISKSSSSAKQSARSSADWPPKIVSGGIKIANQFLRVNLIPKSHTKRLPSGYHWIGVGQSSSKDIAVPSAWTVLKQVPGGSSSGVVVSNPKNPSEKVTLWLNACAGCYSPALDSAEMVTSPDSPLMGVQKGETYTWLNDHAVSYTVPPSKKSKYPTYGLTRTFTGASGDEEVMVNVPASDKQTATTILNSVLSTQ